MNRKTFWLQAIALIFFGSLFVLAWVYDQERILHSDTAFYVFKMIQYGDFMVDNQRYSNVFSQLLPVLALKGGCSIHTFIKLYSVSFILFYYSLFLIITFLYKSFNGGIVMILSLCLGFRHTFYLPVSEIQGTMAVCILLWVHISREEFYSNNKIFSWLLPGIYILVCFWFHPLSILLVLFVLVAVVIEHNHRNEKKIWMLLAFVLLIYGHKFLTIPASGYEGGRISKLENFTFDPGKLAMMPSTIYLENFMLTQMKIFLLALVLLMAACAYYRKWLQLFLFSISVGGFYYLNIIVTSNGETPLFYENYLVVLGFFTGIIFATIFSNKSKELFCLLVSIPFVFLSTRAIAKSSSVFSKKIEYIDRLVNYGKKYEARRYIISNADLPSTYVWISWTLPFETFLYSASKNPDSAVTFYATDNINKYDSLLIDKSVFLGPEWDVYMFNYRANKLNQKYFRLPSLGYKKLNSSQKGMKILD